MTALSLPPSATQRRLASSHHLYKRIKETFALEKDSLQYRNYLNILREELRPAMGCTEPVSLAYAAALARDTLGSIPEKVYVKVSGNIIKNVKSVVIPHTDGLHGIESAVAAGIIPELPHNTAARLTQNSLASRSP